MRTIGMVLALAAAALTASAQEYLGQRDFLTTHEADLIREAQEPNARVLTYLDFAALRVELVRQLLEKDEAGRGGKIHRNLEEYGRILEAIDMVIDDALARDFDLSETIPLMLDKQKTFLAALEAVEENDPEDLWRYEFVLEDAVEITSDSIALAEDDVGDRKERVLASDEDERAAREAKMSEARRTEVNKAKKEVEKAEERQRGPSLLKQGESLDEANKKLPKKDK